MKTQNILLAVFCFAAGRQASAADAEEAATTTWSATSHAGLGMVDRSSAGFAAVAGTMMYFDAARVVGTAESGLALGIRTLAEGGEGTDRTFYRMGSGPLLTWQASDDWNLAASLGWFKEAVTDRGGGAAYSSRGRAAMLSWDRALLRKGQATLTWGGFCTYHSGSVEASPPSANAASTMINSLPKTNVSLTHGLSLGFDVRL